MRRAQHVLRSENGRVDEVVLRVLDVEHAGTRRMDDAVASSGRLVEGMRGEKVRFDELEPLARLRQPAQDGEVFRLADRAHRTSHVMPFRKELLDDVGSDKARCSGDENVAE